VFPDASSMLSGDAQLFWDNVNKRLDVGTSTTNTTAGVVSKLQVSADENPVNGDAHQVIITGAQGGANANKMLELGYNTTANNGTIQSYTQLVSPTNLAIQPSGGRALVGNAA